MRGLGIERRHNKHHPSSHHQAAANDYHDKAQKSRPIGDHDVLQFTDIVRILRSQDGQDVLLAM
jgi:hypothetical protein